MWVENNSGVSKRVVGVEMGDGVLKRAVGFENRCWGVNYMWWWWGVGGVNE